jgi:hypothetical protein
MASISQREEGYEREGGGEKEEKRRRRGEEKEEKRRREGGGEKEERSRKREGEQEKRRTREESEQETVGAGNESEQETSRSRKRVGAGREAERARWARPTAGGLPTGFPTARRYTANADRSQEMEIDQAVTSGPVIRDLETRKSSRASSYEYDLPVGAEQHPKGRRRRHQRDERGVRAIQS